MRPGLLLVNLGSPASPKTADVKAYLREFLSDPSVIEMPRALWQPILKGIILPTRSWRSATFYADSWTKQGSPLIVNSRAIHKKVQACLPNWNVRLAMTYGEPDIGQNLRALHQSGCDPLIVLPLFPQYTQSTHQGIIRQADATGLDYQLIDHFYDQTDYVKLLAAKLWSAYQQHDYDTVVFSYHSIPTAMVRHGDPYQRQCEATTKLVLDQLPDLPQRKVVTAYQSKFGPLPWLKPYLKNELMSLVELGKRKVLLVTPSFVTDCLETLEEDAVQNYQTFKASGGERLDITPLMNADPQFCRMLANLATQRLEVAQRDAQSV